MSMAQDHAQHVQGSTQDGVAAIAADQRDRGGPGTPLLSVRGLIKHFGRKGGLLTKAGAVVRAVDGVDFDVAKGETLGIVGESGCGKSTTARLIMQIIAPDAGDILFDGEAVGSAALDLTAFRKQVQMVFQDSYASLNPRLTVEDTIAFGPRVHGLSRRTAIARAHDLLDRVGLEPSRFAGRYPHEISGGQRQRVNIARGLALEPRLLILDEAVSALDKSVEAQVLNLLLDLKDEFGLTFIFISHDLNVVRFMSDRVMVMYLGKVAEVGPVGGDLLRSAASLLGGSAGLHAVDGPGQADRGGADFGRPAQSDQPAARRPLSHPLQDGHRLVRPQPSPSFTTWAADISRLATSPIRAPAIRGWRRRDDGGRNDCHRADRGRPAPHRRFRHWRENGARRGGGRPHARQGRDRRAARRIRLGQERHVARARAPAPEVGADRRRDHGRGRDVLATAGRELARYRGGVVSMVFQDPGLAFDPVYRVGDQIAEAVVRHECVVVPRGPRARARAVRTRPHPVPGAPARQLSARNVGRHAPARHDRACAGLPAAGSARRRADDGARRHGANPGAPAAARVAARTGAWRSSSSPTTSASRSRSPTASP